MSRYTATIRMADPHAANESVACDGVHVDGSGNLYVQVTCHGDVQTVARFQHGHWASYALEEPSLVEAIREATRRLNGCMTLNECRDRIGEPPVVDTDACAEMPVKAEALPEVGSVVHLWRDGDNYTGCTLMPVAQHLPADDDDPGGLLLGPALRPDRWPHDFTHWLTRTHDETRTQSGSWHWPCDDDGQDAEPEPKLSAPNITINFAGSVLSERDLRDMIRKILTDDARRDMPSGFTFGR